MTQIADRKVDSIYDDYYAPMYDDIWSKNPIWQAEVQFHIQTITDLLKPDNKWLDVGCGTGFLMSKFTEVDRTGLDLSRAMLREAEKQNPGVPLIEQCITKDNPDLDNGFDLVTCTGQPWSFLRKLEDIERAAENLAKWTSKEGVCMLTPIDISDMMENQLPKFYDLTQVPNESSFIRGIFWTYKELDSVYHECILPNIDEWIRWFSVHFCKIEIVSWPHEPAYLIRPKRVIICSEKREVGDDTPVKIIEHPVPQKPGPISSPLSYVSSKQIAAELISRVQSGRIFKAVLDKIFPKS